MSALFRSYCPIRCQFGLTLAVLCLVVLPLGAQSGTTSTAKPKVKLAPRPLPGLGSSSATSGSISPGSGPDTATAEADARARVPLYRQASVTRPGSSQVDTPSPVPPTLQDSDRARILVIRRRGTFAIPKAPPKDTSAIVNDMTMQPVPTETVPVALPPGKIRVIPKDSVKIGTPPPPQP